MNVSNTVRVAWKAIVTNKTRSLLTMLGVIIGVGSVILLTSIGAGIQEYIEGQFDELGANTILVLPLQVFNEDGGFSNTDDRGSLSNRQFDERTVRQIAMEVPDAKIILPESSKQAIVEYKSERKQTSILGTTEDYAAMRNTELARGRFFDDRERRAGERVAVLGSQMAIDLFGMVDPVGKTLRVSDVNFTVVGVAEPKGRGFGGPPFDSYVFIPLEAFYRLFDSTDINSISIQMDDKEKIDETVKKLDSYFLDKEGRKEEEFDVFDQREILNTVNQILGMLTLGLGGIAAISLVVGGIGIMNIMLVSVTERTREIGLRKALGATPTTILYQFLIESSLLSVMGGAIGVLLAAALSFVIKVAADFPSSITPGSIGIAFGVSVGVGIVFGVAPARKASKLSPIEALRSE